MGPLRLLRRLRTRYASLTGMGVRRASAALFPVRRRLPFRPESRIDLVSGETLRADPSESLLTMFEEIWVRRGYLPASWHPDGAPVVVDIGANVGVFTIWAARVLGARRVLAVEPWHGTAERLRRNLALNGIEGVSVLEAAVGGGPGEATLYRRGPASMHTLYLQDRYRSAFHPAGQVPVVTLDGVFERFGIERCHLLKLDCEGAEYDILFAASEGTLGRIDHVVGEYHDGMNEHRSSELDGFLAAHGFAVTRYAPLDEEGGHFHASRS